MPDLWVGFPDYYGVLRVAPDASDAELRSAWRAAAKRWHPDTNDGRDSESMMRKVNEAWEVLGDRDARAIYDRAYFAWRSGSEQLAADLTATLEAHRNSKQSRAASEEWGRWGREDRGRWERAGDEREDMGRGRSGQGASGARRDEADATGRGQSARDAGPGDGRGSKRDERSEPASRSDGSGPRQEKGHSQDQWVPLLIGGAMAFVIIAAIFAAANS